jgi:Zn-dependent membrane protease YugP
MKESHVVTQDEYVGAKDALKWAARTYLVAALAAVANVLYFALRLVNSRD